MFLYYVILLIGLIYACLKYVYSYWARIGFPYIEPVIPYGNMKNFAKEKVCFGINVMQLYQQAKKPFVGTYMFFCPILLIRDVELVHKILVTDFDNFYDRGLYINEEREPLSASIISQTGTKWKCLRQKLSPLFSTGKLKNMFSTILNEVDNLDNYVGKKAESEEVIEFIDLLHRYMLNVIGSVFFGIDLDTIADPNHPFKKINDMLQNKSVRFFMALMFLAPKLIDLFRIEFFKREMKQFYYDVVNSTISYRDTNNVRRNDFMQLLLDMRNTDSHMTVDEITANAFLFTTAGVESTSNTSAFCLYELASKPNLMQRAKNEIDEILSKHNNEITYDSIQEMEFLEMCIKETLRMYPGLSTINRECTKDYKVPDSDLTIKKGTSILISTLGLHNDPRYFEDPQEFVPERFKKGAETYNKDAYLPFGDGPRQCIAVRMGFMASKAAVVQILSKYDLTKISDEPLEIEVQSIVMMPKGGIPLKVTKRNKVN